MLPLRRPLTGHGARAPPRPHAAAVRRSSGEKEEEGSGEPALFRLKAERDPDRLFRLFKSNSRNRLVVENRYAFEDTVARLAGARRFEHIENLLEHHKSLPHARREGFMVRIITLYGLAGMADHALHTFLTMPLFGRPPTVKSFNATLSALSRTRRLPSLSSFLRHAPAMFRLRPDVLSMNIAIKCFCDFGMVQTAYLTISGFGLRPDVVTYTTLLSALYKRDVPIAANGLWNLMVLRGCPPNLATFNARVQFLAAHGCARQAHGLMGLMPLLGVRPDAITYNLVMKGLFLAGSADAAEALFYAFRETGRAPGQKMYQTVIHYMCRVGRFDKAYILCCSSMGMGLFPNIDTLCTLVKGLVRDRRREDADRVVASAGRRVPPFSRARFYALRSAVGDG